MPRKAKEINRKPLHIKTGDDVIVISGEGKSKSPRKVLAVLPKDRKVIVEGVNLMKDRVKQNQGGRQSGINEEGIVEKAFPIDASKVMLVDPKSKKRTRVKTSIVGGKRERVAVKSGETI
ncbi:MAG TPA: 50S ribosomal protein L24 [Abditibacteriaceae bacterium]